jgi:hypothetical protein
VTARLVPRDVFEAAAIVARYVDGVDRGTVWPRCGHPRNAANTLTNGRAGRTRCKACTLEATTKRRRAR